MAPPVFIEPSVEQATLRKSGSRTLSRKRAKPKNRVVTAGFVSTLASETS